PPYLLFGERAMDSSDLAHFVWRNSIIIGLIVIAIVPILSSVEAWRHGQKRIPQGTLQFIIGQVLVVPLVAFLTIYCSQFPDRIADDPDPFINWCNDARNYWRPFAIFDICLIAWFCREQWYSRRIGRATQMFKHATQLLSEGRTVEAKAAFLEA